jgi:division protein 1
VEDYEDRLQRVSEQEANQDPLDRITSQNSKEDYDWDQEPSFSGASQMDESGPCVRTLEGHSKSVTSLYYEDGCLVCSLVIVAQQGPGLIYR